MATRSRDPASCARVAVVVGATLLLACSAGGGGAAEPGRGGGSGGQSSGGSGGTVSATGGVAPGVTGATGGMVVVGSGGVGLYSSVFEPAAGAGPGEPGVEPCDYEAVPGCDYARIDGCCERVSCQHASPDPWDTYPVDTCNELVACVRTAGCSTASDPLCFMDEDPSGPCLDEIYAAQHSDADGPYAFALELMKCVCGY